MSNNPNVPDNARNWDSIDIFLFSNGQQYSPPRKYHLKCDELKWWNGTLSHLARSQYGSMCSNIDLYTLDGKKIDAPLELNNDTAYVAVKSPDAFLQAGYEKYLLKASRSREKRQGRLNSTETPQSANIKINTEQFKSNLIIPADITVNNEKRIEDGDSLKGEIEYLGTIANNIFSRSQKYAESVSQAQTTNNSHETEKPKLLQKRKTDNVEKNTILKKIYQTSKNKNNEQNVGKKRNTSFPKNLIKSTNNSKPLIKSSNNTTLLKSNIEEKIKLIQNSQSSIIKTDENIYIKEIKEKTEQLESDPIIKKSLLGSSAKDTTVLSDVYKNTDSDIQSLFIDADRKTALLNNNRRKVSHDLHIVEEIEDTPKNCKAISSPSTNSLRVNQASDISKKPGTFNLNLNINLKGYTVLKNQDKENHENKCKSYVALMKSEKASQANIDVNLSTASLDFENDVRYNLQSSSVEPNLSKSCEKHIGNNNKKAIIIRCKCNLLETDTITTSTRNSKEKDNYVLLIPTPISDKYMQGNNFETRRISEKETQELLHTCIYIPVTSNSEIMSIKNPENATKHKVSISQEGPKEFNFNNIELKSQGDMHSIKTNYVPVYKNDSATQTDWCNVLLQAKCHEDGRYTFNLPSLHLLTKYNLL